jgi:hypothetical protein
MIRYLPRLRPVQYILMRTLSSPTLPPPPLETADFEWVSLAEQSTTITNQPREGRRKLSYSYLKEQVALMSNAATTTTADGTLVYHYVRVSDRRQNLLMPRLDITRAYDLLNLASSTAMKLRHVETLGRHFNTITLAQICFVQKYHLEPPHNTVLSRLERDMESELLARNWDQVRLVLETRTVHPDGSFTLKQHLKLTLPLRHLFFIYLGLAAIEDPKILAPRAIYRVLKKMHHPTLQQTIWSSHETNFEQENLHALIAIDKLLAQCVEPHPLSEVVLSLSMQPMMLRFNGCILSLPPLPDITAAKQFPHLLEVVFGMHGATKSGSPSVPRVARVSDLLDKIGDRILWVILQEYFLQRHKLLQTLAVSNAVLARLVYLYDFPRMHLRLRARESNHKLGLGPVASKGKLEVWGDLLERFIAISYMVDPTACMKWLFLVFDTIQEAVMISVYQKEVQGFTDLAKLDLRFKPRAPEIEYISKEVGEAIEVYVSRLMAQKPKKAK